MLLKRWNKIPGNILWISSEINSKQLLRSGLDFLGGYALRSSLADLPHFPFRVSEWFGPYFCPLIPSTRLVWAFFKLVKWWNASFLCLFGQDIRLRTSIRPLLSLAKVLRTWFCPLRGVDQGLFVCIYWIRNFPRVIFFMFYLFGDYRTCYIRCVIRSEFPDRYIRIDTIDRKLPKVLYDLNKSIGYFRKVDTYQIYRFGCTRNRYTYQIRSFGYSRKAYKVIISISELSEDFIWIE